jgi:hypothetical protein
LVRGVEIILHAKGGQSKGVVEHPAFVRITFERGRWAAAEALFDWLKALGEECFISRLFLDDAAGCKHERNFAIEEKTARGLNTVGTRARVGHEKKMHAAFLFERERLVDNLIDDGEVFGLERGVAFAHFAKSEGEKSSAHEIPFGVGTAHAFEFAGFEGRIAPELDLISGESFGVVGNRVQIASWGASDGRAKEEVQGRNPNCGGEEKRQSGRKQFLTLYHKAWTCAAAERSNDLVNRSCWGEILLTRTLLLLHGEWDHVHGWNLVADAEFDEA